MKEQIENWSYRMTLFLLFWLALLFVLTAARA
jgi:hypothetical protein